MKALRKDDWEKEAKRLAVGQSARIYHGAERRPNLVIRNLEDRYTAYCHSCHEGSVIMKEVVKVVQRPPQPKERVANNPGVLKPYELWDAALTTEIMKFLHSKDMSIHVLAHTIMPAYSQSDNRLVFTTPDQVVGRDLSGNSHSKWYSYVMQKQFCRAAFEGITGKDVWLTEDYFSALKGQFHANRLNKQNILFVALMGTELHSDLAVELCNANRVRILLDHDTAGLKAAPLIARSLDMLSIPYSDCTQWVGEGLDPKNMNCDWWSDLLG